MTGVVCFTRDLRVHDHPALVAALDEHEEVVPLFVLDEGVLSSSYNRPNRARFLRESLVDLDESLRSRGGALVVRRGDAVEEVVRLAREVDAATVYVSDDVSGYAQRRAERLAKDLAGDGRELRRCPGVTVVPPGACLPADRDHASTFTPYLRKWLDEPKRPTVDAPARVRLPAGVHTGRIPALAKICAGSTAPDLAPGGERAGRARLRDWLASGVEGYADGHDDLAGDSTSRLSPYLHFGCVSPGEVVGRADRRRTGADAFVRQVAWRDFHHQVLAARPRASAEDYRTRHDRWADDPQGLQAWRQGRTGYPLVDAGMRQLAREGWMHNRARLVTAGFLTKDLYVDWREGARHFLDQLVDGDVANNQMNWQWVAGTGNDTRPNRVFNPLRQAERYDPAGDYVRRYLPELADLEGADVHAPWRLPEDRRRALDYPAPLVDHAEAVRRFRRARGKE